MGGGSQDENDADSRIPPIEAVGFLIVNYLSSMFSEVVATTTVVGAAVIFSNSSEVTGFSNSSWSLSDSILYLLAMLLPELLMDVVGTAFLLKHGVRVDTIIAEVHGTWSSLLVKFAQTLFMIPPVVIAARERKWD